MDECTDPEHDWYPQRTVCYKTMASASANARYDARHDAMPFHDGSFGSWTKDRSPAHPFHFRDGVTVWVHGTDLNPDDDFLDSADLP